MEFQIRQSWGNEIYAWEYFEINNNASKEDIEEKAIQVIKDEWKNRKKNNFGFSAPEKCKSKIKVAEWSNGKKVKGGIRFDTNWR